MRRSAKEEREFVAIMAKELPKDWSYSMVEDWCRRIMRKSTTLRRLAEDACNVEMNDRQQARHDLADDRAEDAVTKICAKLGITPNFNGDPRGASIKLVVPSGKTNDWGQEGICVP